MCLGKENMTPNSVLEAEDIFADDEHESDVDEEQAEIAQERYWELFHENTELWRGKWIYDGCKTILEMIERLKSSIESLEELHKDGWKVSDEVQDDYATLIPPNMSDLITSKLSLENLPIHNLDLASS